MGDDKITADDLQASHPDVLSEPSKKLVSIQKRNSEQGKRLCNNPSCQKALALSNNGPYCFTCERKIRLGTIRKISTKYITENDMDLDFDSNDVKK